MKTLTVAQARALRAAFLERQAHVTKLAAAQADATAALQSCDKALRKHAPKQVKAADDAADAIATARAELVDAERAYKQLVDRYLDRIPVGVLKIAGLLVEHAQSNGHRTFQIAKYLDAGGKLTVAMKPYYSPGKVSDTVTVTDAPAA